MQVREPAQHPSVMAGLNRNTRCPSHSPVRRGMVVAIAPARSSMGPTERMPEMNVGAACMPTTAMNTLRPRLFMSQSAPGEMCPNLGCRERNHPKRSPAISAPPLVPRLTGMGPMKKEAAPAMPPMKRTMQSDVMSDVWGWWWRCVLGFAGWSVAVSRRCSSEAARARTFGSPPSILGPRFPSIMTVPRVPKMYVTA